jgi:DNA-binding MurR/RpiR family transcriptional regulator
MSDSSLKHSFKFIDRMKQHYEKFTPQQRVFSKFLNANPESLGFSSIIDISNKSGVSQATIIRFCNKIGYTGYSELNEEVRGAIQLQYGSVDRFKLSQLVKESINNKEDDSIFSRMISREMENIFQLSKIIKVSEFRQCVQRVLKSDRVAVIGSQASTSLVIHMFQMLSKVLNQVDKITHHEIEAASIIRRLNKKSLAFVISFPRYAKITLKLAEALKEKGVFIVVLTDTHQSPAIEMSNLTFFIPVDVPSFVDGYAAPIALINALVTEIGMQDADQSQKALDHYDTIVNRYDLFIKKGSEWPEGEK